VKNREYDLGRGALLLLHDVNRDATAVVADGAAVVGVNCHRDFAAVPGEGFVYRVVYDFVDKVVKPAGAGRPDVHARSLADCLQAFQDRDVLGAIRRVTAARIVSQLMPFKCG
jgi:hypothetical protein